IKTVGKKLLKEYKNFDRDSIHLKSHHEIVTRADLLSEEIIIKRIRTEFPAHQILSEEKGEVGQRADYLWIIDPIDGTTNFSMHNPLWSISIGLVYKREIILGLVYAPVIDELFLAEHGQGVFLNGKKIAVSSVKDGKVLNTFCHGSKDSDIKKAIKYYREQKLKRLDCRQMGSAAIELAYVACGRIESITIPGANIWDVAAGVLLVQEAGGRVSNFLGQEWNLESKDMLASNGLVHQDILGVINKK
ncbi:MAG: inositol monophosphatase family protein, partial [Patescibacteria group bacterium]|nr:inositol monophosphatase family protein [Patescibacteria group bacterium]